MRSGPIDVLKKSAFTCTRPPILLPRPRFCNSNLCTLLGAGQRHQKTREGCAALSIPCFHSTAVCLCSARAPHSRVPTAVYVSSFYKSLFGSSSADLVFGSPRLSADTSESPCAVEVILNLQVPAAAVKESRICFCSSHVSSL